MNDSTLLFRQINPYHFVKGRVSSQAFKPMPKDQRRLSCYDGSQITAENAFKHFTGQGCKSIGVMAVAVNECGKLELPVDQDGVMFKEHTSIVFPDELSGSQVSKKAKSLSEFANCRGWQYQK